MIRINNTIRVPCAADSSFFKYWLTLLRPYHGLTDKEILVLAEILRKREDISAKITDPELLDKVLFTEDVKKEIREICDIPIQYFQVMLSKFRKKGIIVNNKINQKLIPKLTPGEDTFKLMFLFDFQNVK